MENVEAWRPDASVKSESEDRSGLWDNENRLSLDKFDIGVILKTGKPLVGSEGKQFEKVRYMGRGIKSRSLPRFFLGSYPLTE